MCVSVQRQKVNYNVNQLTKKAWKRQDGPTSMRVPPDAVYPGEDDYTEALLNIQSRNSEDATGRVSLSWQYSIDNGLHMPQLHPDKNSHSLMLLEQSRWKSEAISAIRWRGLVIACQTCCEAYVMSRNQEAYEPTREKSMQAIGVSVTMAHVLRAGCFLTSFCIAVARAAPNPCAVRQGE